MIRRGLQDSCLLWDFHAHNSRMVRHDVGRAKPIVFFSFFFLVVAVTYVEFCSEYNPSHICQSIGICLNSSVLYVYYSHQLSLHIQFLHGPTANDAHNANGGESKGLLMSNAGLGIPTSPKKGRIADVDGRQELGFHEGPSLACKRFEPWESNYRF